MSKSILVMGSLRKALIHTSLSGILDPMAPLVNIGTLAVAAGADILLGAMISKFSSRFCSNFLIR